MRWFVLFFLALKVYGSPIEKEREHLEKFGYVWIKNFYSKEQVELLKGWAEEVHESALHLLELSEKSGQTLQHFAKVLPGALIVVPEASNFGQICRAEDMLSCFPKIYHFIFGTVSCYLSEIMEEPYTLFKDKVNFKWPGGGAFLPHQDYPAYARFSHEHITAMVCIDSATIENGCLYVAEDWKKSLQNDPEMQEQFKEDHFVLPYHEGGMEHGSIQKKYSERFTWLPIEAEAGDVIFFDSYLPHYSENNKSSLPRRAMFFTHNPLREGDHRAAYYHAKREDPDNPLFHFATPTKARSK